MTLFSLSSFWMSSSWFGQALGLGDHRALAAGQPFQRRLVALGKLGLVLGVFLQVLGLVLVGDLAVVHRLGLLREAADLVGHVDGHLFLGDDVDAELGGKLRRVRQRRASCRSPAIQSGSCRGPR